jgi:hypothetical protein
MTAWEIFKFILDITSVICNAILIVILVKYLKAIHNNDNEEED